MTKSHALMKLIESVINFHLFFEKEIDPDQQMHIIGQEVIEASQEKHGKGRDKEMADVLYTVIGYIASYHDYQENDSAAREVYQRILEVSDNPLQYTNVFYEWAGFLSMVSYAKSVNLDPSMLTGSILAEAAQVARAAYFNTTLSAIEQVAQKNNAKATPESGYYYDREIDKVTHPRKLNKEKSQRSE